MKTYVIASLLLLGFTAPAFAATMAAQDARDTSPGFSYKAKDHWAVDDTVGNCAVIDTKPSAYDISGLKIIGNKSGYPNLSAAQKEMKSDTSVCKGLVGPA
jgi:hypothetical protein